MRAAHDPMGFIPQDRGAYHAAAVNLPVPIGMFMPPPVPAFQQPPVQPSGRCSTSDCLSCLCQNHLSPGEVVNIQVAKIAFMLYDVLTRNTMRSK